MYLALTLDPSRDADLQFAQQLGVNWIVADPPSWEKESLAASCNRVRQAGLKLAGMECLPRDLYGGEIGNLAANSEVQRDTNIAHVCQLLRTLGELHVPAIGYRWFPGQPARGTVTLEERGRVLTTLYRSTEQGQGVAPSGREVAWQQLGYFLSRVLPVAEASGVRLAHQMGLPDAPWLAEEGEPLDQLERLFTLGASAAHGLDLDHGLFAQLPGLDAAHLIRRLCQQRRVFGVRVRALQAVNGGLAEHYLDKERATLLSQLRAYREGGFEGPLRVASPRIGEDTAAGHTGQAFSIGYLRALLQAMA